jgi:hypothetical protein
MAASAQASDLDHGVEEISPELIERRQTLISPDDLEGEVTATVYCVYVWNVMWLGHGGLHSEPGGRAVI